ncbi:major intrinsically disordered Notch2-binding receptor 1 [Polymixia lowei]
MDPVPEYSLFLVRILEELDTKHSTMSYQDLCKSLCARFDLVHLAKLRSLLFYTACLDPAFPATLFKDKMRCSVEDQQSKKLMVAADIVTMFNLIQMNGGIAKDKLPVMHRAKFHKNQSLESSRSETDAYKFQDCERGAYDHMVHPREGHHHHHHRSHQHPVSHNAPPCPKSECNNCQQFIPTSDPNFLLGIGKDLKCRAASLDKLQHLPQYSSGSPPSPPCEMQSTYFPMDIDSESTTDQDSLQHISHPEPFSVHSCVQKRTIFKEDFHNLQAFSPQVITSECKQGSKASHGYHRRELHKPTTFFNHSFELPYNNPYFEPPLNSPIQERRRAKHESLDDLQASTYFGPTTVSECVSTRRHANKPGRQPSWPVKSLSLNTEEGPPDFERSFLNSKPLKENHRQNFSIINNDNEQHFQSPMKKAMASPSGFMKKTNGIKTKEVASMACGPGGMDKREAGKRFRDKNMNSSSFQGGVLDSSSSVGTQTEQAEHKKAKEYAAKYGERERRPFKHPDEELEVVSDDISDIFRFLDDMSVCDSLGVIQSSCYNSNGSLSQVTTKSDGDSSPERNTVKLAKSKLDRLFHSLENTDDELKSSVCKLVMRIGEIEKKLESLSGVRGEISQVLSKLNKLDEKIQEPETNGRQGETASASSSVATPDHPHPHPHPHSDPSLSPHVFQCHTTGHNVKVDNGASGEWCCSDGSNSESLRVKALKKSMFTRRSSRSLNEENSATESKVASITNSPRDWRTVSYSSHPGDEGKDKDRDRESKERHRKAKEAERERQYELPQAHRPPKPPPKDSYLIEQVFSPHPFLPSVKAHVKGSPLYTDLRLTGLSDGKRGQPSWTIEEYKRNSGEKGKQLTALDLQTQESLNPNNLEYWMEDIYTPGYDSLLKRKEAEFRRAKVCKIGALIAAATCTVILVIVVPICTMKS